MLIYTDTSAPGFGRRRCGRGFVYLSKTGRVLKDQRLINYCRSLAIPPAWTQVWISSNRNTHIQSTGLDDRARRQYIYHPQWTLQQNQQKFTDLLDFGLALPPLRIAIDRDLRRRYFSKKRVVATVVKLIDTSLIRVGNDIYQQRNKSHGATTLREKHVEVVGRTIHLDFSAKSGKRRNLSLEDAALARSIRACQEMPGQRLFQYHDDKGQTEPVYSNDVNDYLKRYMGHAFTARTFRTWGASVHACKLLSMSDTHGKSLQNAIVKEVASRLGNTVAVARQSYVHPALLASALDGSCSYKTKRRRKGLSLAETSLLHFLRELQNR